MFDQAQQKRLAKLPKAELVKIICAYEKYWNDCVNEQSYPVGMLGFLDKEYPLAYREMYERSVL